MKRDFTWLGWRHNIHNRHNLFTKLSLQILLILFDEIISTFKI